MDHAPGARVDGEGGRVGDAVRHADRLDPERAHAERLAIPRFGYYFDPYRIVVKEYASYLDPHLTLDFSAIQGDVEVRLSRLAGMALTTARAGRDYGLELPGVRVPTGSGEAHQQQVLRALATFGVSDDG